MGVAGPRIRRIDWTVSRWGGFLIGVFLAAGAAGCATTTHDQLVDFVHSHDAEVSTGHYAVRPPDVITINAPSAPEIDGTSQRVRADGKVVLRLLGEVDVVGLTTDQIAEKLETQLARYYVDPEVVVQVAAYNSQYYYVFGEVRYPGPKRFTGRDTLLRALSDAEPTFLGWRSQIRVVRPTEDGKDSKTIVVNLNDMLKKGDLSRNFLLQEGDVIEVPPTPLAWVGHRVREVLYPLLPAVEAFNAPARAIESYRTYTSTWGDAVDDNNDDRWRLAP